MTLKYELALRETSQCVVMVGGRKGGRFGWYIWEGVYTHKLRMFVREGGLFACVVYIYTHLPLPPPSSPPSPLPPLALHPVILRVTNVSTDSVHLSWSQPSAYNIKDFIILSAIKALLPPSSLSSLINTSLFTSEHISGYNLEGTVDGLEQGVTYVFLVLYSMAGTGSQSEPSRAVEATTLTSGCGLGVCHSFNVVTMSCD